MNILAWIGVICGILMLTGIGICVHDGYKYPVCPKCGDNLKTKRIKGEIICQIHGKIPKERKEGLL